MIPLALPPGVLDQELESLKITVLLGGTSAEREVSLAGGTAIAATLASMGHEVLLLDPKKTDCLKHDWSDCDLAFIALHGAFGEDGYIQAILDRAGVVYTGSGSASSRLAFSKSASKVAFRGKGIATPEHKLISRADSLYRCMAVARSIGYPLVMKPDRQGSSLGVTFVHQACQLEFAINKVFDLDDLGLMEQAIPGEEWTVAVFDGMALPPIHIQTHRDFFDFEAKYNDDATTYDVIDLDASPRAAELAAIAVDACQALGTAGVARVDFRVDPEGRPFVLEVNTVPGMTSHSLVPKAAAHIGWDFPTLCQRIIWSAFAHHHSASQSPHAEPLRKAV
jgi:D-alanine-D-alanine ligase